MRRELKKTGLKTMNSARKFKSIYRTLQYTFGNMMIHTFFNQFIIYVHMCTIYLANLQGIQCMYSRSQNYRNKWLVVGKGSGVTEQNR